MACTRRKRRGAFSLAELVVAVGILVLMLSLAGQVFNLTIKSTGQALALTEVSQLLRAFEQTIREDLRHVHPGQSLLLIQGNPVNAYWTQEGKEADDDDDPANGYPHPRDPQREDEDGNLIKPRADILMFFTARKGTSLVDPQVTSKLQQVVYGHAVLGEYVPGTGRPGDPPYDFEQTPENELIFPEENGYPDPDDKAPVPAERWHLARRSVLVLSAAPPPNAEPPWAEAETDPDGNLTSALGSEMLLQGETDVIGSFRFEEFVLRPGPEAPWYLPAVFNPAAINDEEADPFARSKLDPTPPPLYANRLGAYFLPNCASFKVEWSLNPRSEFVAGRLDGTKEVYWFDPGRFDADDATEHPLAALEEARDAAAVAMDNAPPNSMEYERLQQIWLNFDNLLDGRTIHPDFSSDGDEYSLADRFLGQQLQIRRDYDPADGWLELAWRFAPRLPTEARRPNLVVFGAARCRLGTACGPTDIVPEDIFPGALRITIDLFDSERRLERPVRHVMVIPIGS